MKVYMTAKLPANAKQMMTDAGLIVTEYDGDGLISHAELLQRVSDIDILITPLSTVVDKEVISAAPKLKLIANFGAGFNNIDTQAAAEKNIPVTNTPFVSTTSTAELTTGLIISLSHRIVEGDHVMRTTGFDGWAPLYFLGHELAGKTLGIIGMGQIGYAVATRMKAFGMQIVYSQRHPLAEEQEQQIGAKFLSLPELINQADVISIHSPLTPGTEHMLGSAEFKATKSSAYLVNAARGPIIDEEALLAALQQHEIAGAALDVYEHEPHVADGFKQLPNVILTPHIGNATVEARGKMAQIVADNAIRVATKQEPQYVVNNV